MKGDDKRALFTYALHQSLKGKTMKRMLMLDGKEMVVFDALGNEDDLKWFRKELPEYFKNARIKEILQAEPSKICYGQVYEKGFRGVQNRSRLIIYGDGSVYDCRKERWVRGGSSGKDCVNQ
jgi:hypothetical protein